MNLNVIVRQLIENRANAANIGLGENRLLFSLLAQYTILI